MNTFEKVVSFLNSLRMEQPEAWGSFHIICVVIAVAAAAFFVYAGRHSIHIEPNKVFAFYGFTTLALELTKQIMWAFNEGGGAVAWSYSWYSAPFQFCTAPMYVTIALCFVKNKKIREELMAFLGFYSILSMTMVMLVPDTIFTSQVLINVHTSFLHFGGFVLDVFVLAYRLVRVNLRSVLKGGKVFLCFVAAALFMDVAVYKSGLCGENVFNMFFISPYFDCTLPVFSELKEIVPYPVFLLSYISAFFLGAFIVLRIVHSVRQRTAHVLHRKWRHGVL